MRALFVMGFALATVPARALSAQAQPLAPADVFALAYASDAQISPDGQWIAFVRKWSDIQSDSRFSNIWLAKADGTQSRALTTGSFVETSPRWSPDGTRLLYLSNKSGRTQLQLHTLSTGAEQTLTSGAQPPSAPTWSADGSQLAYLSLVPSAPLVIG
jgi:acylaminoacyl-peptidase